MSKLIVWTTEEKQKLAICVMALICHNLNMKPAEVSEDIIMSYKRFFSTVVVPAMHQAIGDNRIRALKQHNDVPWLVQKLLMIAHEARVSAIKEVAVGISHTSPVLEKALTAVCDEPLVKEDLTPFSFAVSATNSDIVRLAELIGPLLAPLIAREVVSLLASEYKLTPLSYVEKHSAEMAAQVKEKAKVKILIYGLLPAQTENIKEGWNSKFNFIFKSDGEVLVKNALNGCDHAIGMTSFMSHAADANLKKFFKSKYIRTTGSTSSVNKVLSDMWAALNLKQSAIKGNKNVK